MKIDILAEKRAQEKAAKLAKRLAVVKHFESLTDDTYILSELKMIVHKINRPSNKPGKLTPQQ